eukprot:TRINITY_DN3801_c0_g1_i3.p1 TRINITY_DN3801_c0_g1~~TRINITY_DN3801_c0_g1_i3.p1  ORF type:complete len:361 (-),score=32.70 TRINITY_DN3801_c0_g1_i3:1129-2211(-)
MQHNQKQLRLYQDDWGGNEVFFCGGRLVAGPGWKNLFLTVGLILVPLVVFLVWPARYVSQEVSWAFFGIGLGLGLLSLVWLFITGCMDPGIVAREKPDEQYLRGEKPRTMDVLVNGHNVTVRYDDTCHFYRPPRCHHCSINDNCILKFDHHCPWVGTTIGLRNYRFYLLFISNSTLLCLFVMGVCMYSIHLKREELEEDGESTKISNLFKKTVPALVLIGYAFLATFFVGGLTAFHTYLISSNQTTYENFKRGYSGRTNPYSKGLLYNCWEVWCTRMPPPRINFREIVKDGDIEGGRGSRGSYEMVNKNERGGYSYSHSNGRHYNHNNEYETNGYQIPLQIQPLANEEITNSYGHGISQF